MGQLLFGFDGRIGRSPFWAGQLIVLVLAVLYARYADELLAFWLPGSIFMGSGVALILALPMLWVQAAITIKRCHDRGKTGFWAMMLLVPVLGVIWLVIECGVMPGIDDVRESAQTAPRTAP